MKNKIKSVLFVQSTHGLWMVDANFKVEADQFSIIQKFVSYIIGGE